jgi:3-phosphoshikimate 1-carboxyvinyltransferase
MGARIVAHDGLPPLRIQGGQALQGIEHASDIASAQVKSAVLLAGLQARGTTRVLEAHPTRDYTERMLRAFGWPIDYAPGMATLTGGHRLRATEVSVPADFSSAAFFLVAATVVSGSEVVLRRVGMNPRRTGLLRVLRAMGAKIEVGARGEDGGEPVADLHVRHAPLRGIEVPVDAVPDMIDEFPALFVAAACAQGTTTIHGAAELRVKESDRIATMAAGLRALGVVIEETGDGAAITGGALHGGSVVSNGDHRVAMAFAIAGQVADDEVRVQDIANVATSFPGFDALARTVGFGLREA